MRRTLRDILSTPEVRTLASFMHRQGLLSFNAFIEEMKRLEARGFIQPGDAAILKESTFGAICSTLEPFLDEATTVDLVAKGEEAMRSACSIFGRYMNGVNPERVVIPQAEAEAIHAQMRIGHAALTRVRGTLT